jgi:phosphoribosyl-ATP pyrophosphohydrolase/phosphoribosyl-AMP cyclohydrolase
MIPPPPGPDWDRQGLAAAVVQDATDGRVLMVGWMDAEAYAATLATGEVHFHSRSRNRLWRKGETSGNVLRLRRLSVDCDRDAILVEVDPAGPACHRNTRSCFDREDGPAEVPAEAGAEPGRAGFGWLDQLWATIAARAGERPTGSYTSSLLDGGVDATSRKLIEEATEVILAAKDDAAAESAGADRSATRSAFAGEVADLVYHALVAIAERGVAPAAVIEVLQARAGTER